MLCIIFVWLHLTLYHIRKQNTLKTIDGKQSRRFYYTTKCVIRIRWNRTEFFFVLYFLCLLFFITGYFVLPFTRARLMKETLVSYTNADFKSEEKNLIKTRFKNGIFASHYGDGRKKTTPYSVLHCTMLKTPWRWIHVQTIHYVIQGIFYFFFFDNWQRNSKLLGSVFPNNIRANITFVDQKHLFFSLRQTFDWLLRNSVRIPYTTPDAN